MSASLELVVDNGSVASQPEAARPYNKAAKISRKTLSELFDDVHAGKKALQPHSNITHLKAEGQLAKVTKSDALGLYFAALFNTSKKSAREVGPEKKTERIEQKCRERSEITGTTNDNDPFALANRITDIDRQRVYLRNIPAAQKAIEMVGKVGEAVLPNGETVLIVDVSNGLLNPDANKGNIPELAIKYVVPLTLADGTETYHLSELQFRMEKGAADYELSHDHFEKSRTAADKQATILLTMTTKAKPETIPSLTKEWKKAGEARMLHEAERFRINQSMRSRLHIDEQIANNPDFKPAYANIRPLPGMQTGNAAPRLAQG